MFSFCRNLPAAGPPLLALCAAFGCDLVFSYDHTALQAERDAGPADTSRGEGNDLRAPDLPLPPSPYSCVEHAACLLTCTASGADCPTECGAKLAPSAVLPPRYAELAACYERQRCAAQCSAFDTCAACLTAACAEPLYYCFLEPEQASKLSCPELWTCAVRCQYGDPCSYGDCDPKGDAEGRALGAGVIGGCEAYWTCFDNCPSNGYFFPCYLACTALGSGGSQGCLAAMRECFKDYR